MPTMKTIILPLILLLLVPAITSADITPDDIKNSLPSKLNHPYLYFTEASKPELLERIASDRESRDIFQRLLAEGNRLLYTPVGTTPPPQNPRAGYTRRDDRLIYLRGNVRRAHTLAFLYQMTGEQKYADKAFEFADAVCDLPTWVDIRHQFNVIYSRVWPWNVDDDQASFGVDLETTDTARTLGAVYDWLYPALDKRRRDRIRGAILEKAILRVRGNYEYHWWASSYRCNWCACCNAGLGTASLALMTEDPNLVDVIAESVNRISRQFDEIGVDGGWQEGCGYYRKSIHALNFFADPLKRLSGDTFNLYEHPRIKANPISFLLYNTITPRRLLPFEDSSYTRAGTSHIWNKLATETGSGETAWFRDYMWDEGRDIFDIIWPRATVKPTLPESASRHFRTIDWAVMRSDFTDPEKIVVACKTGMHDDPHHGHLDCGHFIVYWRGQEYISDIGSPEYDELYFDDIRWEYPQTSSAGHNTVLVNGELQIPAKRKDGEWLEGIGGKTLEFTTADTRDYILMDPSGAYPGEELKGWRRHLVLEKPDIVVAIDEIETVPGSEIELRYHSNCDVELKENYVLLKGDKGMMALIPFSENSIELRSGKHPSLPVIQNEKFKWILYFGLTTVSEKKRTIVGSIIIPVTNITDVLTIIESISLEKLENGTQSVLFTSSNTVYTYTFEKSDNGYILK